MAIARYGCPTASGRAISALRAILREGNPAMPLDRVSNSKQTLEAFVAGNIVTVLGSGRMADAAQLITAIYFNLKAAGLILPI
jgi:hypothetical protein